MARRRNRQAGRFATLGLISDLALVGATAGRLARRRSGRATDTASMMELALAGGAALRLLRRLKQRRRSGSAARATA